MSSFDSKIKLCPYDWTYQNDPVSRDIIIYSWCLNRESQSCLVKFTKFSVMCHLELPQKINDLVVTWNTMNISFICDWICKTLKTRAPTSSVRVNKFKMYYYRGPDDKRTFLKLYFKNHDDMLNFHYLLKKGPQSVPNVGLLDLKIWEYDISPIRKFMSQKRCEFSQWFTLDKLASDRLIEAPLIEVPLNKKVSTCVHEYECNWNALHPIDNKVSQTWKLKPGILAIDIETYTDNHKAMPNPFKSNHVVYMISCIYQRLYEPESLKRIALIFGQCEDIPGSEVIRVNSELELIRALEQVIRDTDPEILTGYNISGYDYQYLQNRLDLILENWDISGRLLNVKSEMKTKTLRSKNFGTSKVTDFKVPGRINIDMYSVIKQSRKLDTYKLDFVASLLLGKNKHDVKPHVMFEIYEQCLRVNAREKEVSKIEKDFAIKEMTRVMEYCIQDSVLVIELFVKCGTWMDILQSSSILGITISSILTEGQQVKCVSQIYHECYLNDIVMDHMETREDFEYEGGFVGEPIKGYRRNIICLDFTSMYPSIMQAENISYETLVDPSYDVPDEDCHIYNIDSKEFEDSIGPSEPTEIDAPFSDLDSGKSKSPKPDPKHKVYSFKFVKKHLRVGIIPKIVERLVGERSLIRKRMKTETDPFILDLLDKRQNIMKISANSVYGFLGAYKLPLKQGAMAITDRGRRLIKTVNEYLLKHYDAIIVYNDTDSVFVDMKITDQTEVESIGRKLAEEITMLFPPPLKIEYEKGMRIILLKKKMYSFFEIKKGVYLESEEDIKQKGIVTAKRDGSKWMKNMYHQCLYSILREKPFMETMDIIYSNITKLFNDQVDPMNLVSINEMGSSYKSEGAVMKVFSDNLKREGTVVNAGDRLQFIIIDKPEHNKVGHRMMLYEHFLDCDVKPKIDKFYYLGRAKSAMETLMTVAYKKDFDSLNHLTYTGLGKRKKIKMEEFFDILELLIRDNKTKTIEEIIGIFKNVLKIPKINIVTKL